MISQTVQFAKRCSINFLRDQILKEGPEPCQGAKYQGDLGAGCLDLSKLETPKNHTVKKLHVLLVWSGCYQGISDCG